MRARPLRSPLILLALVLTACAAAPAPDLPPRAQRSANLSHITGTSRKIQMFLKNRNLQLLPDGTVNGTTDDTSEYTVLQRLTTGIGLLKIQGIATCLYLCMDSCGFLYAHDFSDDCVFNEHMEENNYNTYSRTTGGKKTFVALDNRGRPRRLQIPEGRPLGNLSGYALTLTRRLDAGTSLKTCARRHKDKHKRKKLPPPFHRNCARRIQRQKQKRQNKKAHEPERKKIRQPKARRKHDNATTTTEHDWDESTASTTEEFFRSAAAREAVGGRA